MFVQLLAVLCAVVSANGAALQEELPLHQAATEGSCSEVTSVDGAMYTVEVEIGTPKQRVDLVVDTGSNQLIAESCLCRDRGYCDAAGNCFQAQQSSTLSLVEGEQGPETTVMNFGSGSILTEVATDNVQIAGITARMDKGLLLMIDQLLDFGGAFEGILGLGMLNSQDSPLALRIAPSAGRRTASEEGDGAGEEVQMDAGHAAKPFLPLPLQVADAGSSQASATSGTPESSSHFKEGVGNATALGKDIVGPGFLEQAGIKRFSVCFGDDAEASPGILRFDPPVAANPLKSIGTMHWGLDFRGVSIGDSKSRLGFCKKEDMPPSQQTPCGAIPDSGTTYIMGPKDQVHSMIEGICDSWPRCSENHTAMVTAARSARAAAMESYGSDPWDIKPMSKMLIFEMLLADCDSWLADGAGIGELPKLHFHVADDTGAEEAVGVDGSAYVIAAKEKERKIVYKDVAGQGRVPWGYEYTDRKVWVCRPALGPLDYPTETNGPAWILGLPIFAGNTVGFDVSKEPPLVSFTPGPCGGCKSGASLLTPREPTTSRRGWRPRRLQRPPRFLRVNKSQPI